MSQDAPLPSSTLPAPTIDKSYVEVPLDRHGMPTSGTAISRLSAAPAQVFALLRAFERYPGRVPMIHSTVRRGSQLEVELRFKISLLSTRFTFTAEVTEQPDTLMELRWIAGEPRGLHIRHELSPLDGGAATLMRTHVSFDILSLGWLVKFFLKNHPEIQFGVFSGTALAIQHSLKRALASY